MNGGSALCPPDNPIMKAWNIYITSTEYKNNIHRLTIETTPQERARIADSAICAAFASGFIISGMKD